VIFKECKHLAEVGFFIFVASKYDGMKGAF